MCFQKNCSVAFCSRTVAVAVAAVAVVAVVAVVAIAVVTAVNGAIAHNCQ